MHAPAHPYHWTARLEEIAVDVQCDLAVNARLAHDRYATPLPLGAAELFAAHSMPAAPPAFTVETLEGEVTPDVQVVRLQVLCAARDITRLPWWQLRQLLALAEARTMLRCPADRWEVCALKKPDAADEVIPDALYQGSCGLVQVEFDSGEYETRRVDDHTLAYAARGPQTWVVSCARRQRVIQDRLRLLSPDRIDHRVLLAHWW